MQSIEIHAGAEDEGKRLDVFLAEASALSRSAVQQLLAEGHVLVNGRAQPKSYRLVPGDSLAVTIPPLRESELVAQDIPLDIVYEDTHLLVVNKPKGMVVHPAAGNSDGTLVNALLYHCAGSLSGIGGEERPGIVHRIDKDTSGLLVVAKDDVTHRHLAAQFAAHSITRVYHAVVHGGFSEDKGIIDAAIARSRADRKKMAVSTDKNAKHAVTTYRVVARYEGFTHVALRLQTGRTHQIRVHMANIGHPVAGDAVYGSAKGKQGLRGQCLHAKTLGFIHPQSGEEMLFDSELPSYFTAFVATLRRKCGE